MTNEADLHRKTDLAIKCAYTIRDQYPQISVFWVTGSSIEESLRSIVNIAAAIGIQGADAPNADAFGMVRRYLDKPENGQWVMILDHVDDVQSLAVKGDT